MSKTVRPDYWEIKEAALFLVQPNAVDASLAVALYVKALDSEWLYRGCVHAGHPSEAMPLQVQDVKALAVSFHQACWNNVLVDL